MAAGPLASDEDVVPSIKERAFSFDEATLSVTVQGGAHSAADTKAILEPYRQIPGDINVIIPLSMLSQFRFDVSIG